MGLKIISVEGRNTRLNRLSASAPGDVVKAVIKKGQLKSKAKKGRTRDPVRVVIIRQRKPFRRTDGTYLYFEDNAGVILNNDKPEMEEMQLQDLLPVNVPQ